jgi:hypothetical protein
MSTRAFMSYGDGPAGSQPNYFDDQLSPAIRAGGPSLWQGAPQLALIQDMVVAAEFMDDFVGLVTGASAWVTTQATSGTATAGSLAGGTAALNAGATTQHQGIQMQRGGSHLVPALGKHIWFECRAKVNVLQAELLFGLFDTDATLVTAGALHATDGIGFQCLTSDGVILPVVKSASTATTGASVATLTAATYVRLGFVLTWSATLQQVQPYVNGAAVGNPITTNIPTVALTPSFVCQSGAGAGSNPQVDLDYVNTIAIR